MVQLEVDGRREGHVFRAKGFTSDGASGGELRVRRTPGVHRLAVRVATHSGPAAPRQTWVAEVTARPGRLTGLTLDATRGLQLAPSSSPAAPPSHRLTGLPPQPDDPSPRGRATAPHETHRLQNFRRPPEPGPG